MNSIHASFLAEFTLRLRPHLIFLVPCVTYTEFDFFLPSPPGFSLLLGPPDPLASKMHIKRRRFSQFGPFSPLYSFLFSFLSLFFIQMVGGTSLCIKAKWVTLKSWLVPSSLVLLHRQKRQRQKEQKQLYHKHKQQQNEKVQQQDHHQQRRPSQCTTCSSRISSDSQEEGQAHSFFKRRSSQSSHMSVADFQREAEKLYDLFLLAMDEVRIYKILDNAFHS